MIDPKEISILKQCAAAGTRAPQIAKVLGWTRQEVHNRAKTLGIKLPGGNNVEKALIAPKPRKGQSIPNYKTEISEVAQ